MSRLLYYLGTRAYHAGIRLAALVNGKAKQWVDGRRYWRTSLREWKQGAEATPVVWMHCASLGEFEQGRPVLEAIRQAYPNYQLVLTFYSPSGYELRRHYAGADYVAYLPPDGPYTAWDWVEILRPQLAIFVKYDLWYYYLTALRQQRVPAVLIAAHFRPQQVYFRVYGGLFRGLLQQLAHIFLQSAQSLPLLHAAGVAEQRISVVGDPRVDRVVKLPAEPFDDAILTAFTHNHRVLVAGSTWAPDEALLSEWTNTQLPADWKLLLVPHEVQGAEQVASRFALPTVRYTQTNVAAAESARVLVLDTVGMLNRVYRMGQLAYIGGGFGSGLHNILEPAAYDLPVLFGPHYHSFLEAETLVQTGGAYVVTDAATFDAAFQNLLSPVVYQRASGAVQQYIYQHQGATERIVQQLGNLDMI